jgi:ABC-2 type transport system ATP-binding protein
MAVIDVKGLSKDYRQHFWTPLRRVLDNVSFEVHESEIFGFLGPNGAGKSTTIKILFEIIFPTSGSAKLFGQPIGDKAIKAKVGFLPENPYFYDYLSSTQFLEFHGGLMGMDHQALKKRIPEVLELVGMKGTERMYLRSFSKGMLQRIGLAQAIIHNPDLVILDEPMTGLDPLGRREVRDLMLHLKSQKKTVFFSTHILSDVESICHRVAILNKGKLLSCGSLDELISVDVKSVDLVWKQPTASFKQKAHSVDSALIGTQETLFMKIERLASESNSAFEARVQNFVQDGLKEGVHLQSMSPKKESLEDVFVRQVGHLETRI